jgi:two-component system CheB/CheR fusion protein
LVAIGASAGGLEAFTSLLLHLPVDTGMGFVLLQHLDPDHESALADLLSRARRMPVREAANNLAVEANHVYIIPPNASMTCVGGRLKLTPRKRKKAVSHCIDFFLESLARDRGNLAIGVILSGTASDGTLGLEAVKAEGGITFAQDSSAKYDSMPRSAVAAGCVDFVLSPEAISRELARIAKHPWARGTGAMPARLAHGWTQKPVTSTSEGATVSNSEKEQRHLLDSEPDLRKILSLLRSHSGVDFSLYKPTTVHRRVVRRMLLSKAETLEAYARALRGNAGELDALFSDLLISVTAFFRNPEAFESLARKVFPRLLRARREEHIRFWVLGCSTGQEAYSLAMACLECCDHISPAPKLQIFATDLNEVLLEKARRGLYARSLIQDISPERLQRFFVEEEGGYRISKPLRELCIFARHNFLSDPPFSRMDLISCRNLLIYIEPEAQQKILPTFHYALKPDGYLFLGASESIGSFTNLFEPVDKKLKIFTRKPGTPGLHLPVSRTHLAERKAPTPLEPPQPRTPPPEISIQREADRLSLARFAPPGVLVDAGFQILQFRGATTPYLQPPSGKPTIDLFKMARRELILPLRAAFKKAHKQNQVVRTETVRLNQEGSVWDVSLEIIPLINLKERCYLVFFDEAAKTKDQGSSSTVAPQRSARRSGMGESESLPGASFRRRVAELERELAESRDYLQHLQEEHEAAREELQASNEEVTSSNEELQSINEELETSKEELESTNEELTTVNEEMANRNQELNRLNSDLNNLHASVNLPILLLGRDLTIRRFTVQAEGLFNLIATDVGRPLGGVRHNLVFPELEKFVAEVITAVAPREREVQDKDGNWFVLRARPYLSLDNKIDGAVLVLTNINSLKQNERKLHEAHDYANAVIESVAPLLVLDRDLRVETANEPFCQTFGVKVAQTQGRLVYELGNGQWNIPALRSLLEDILPKKHVIYQYEVTHQFEDIGQRTMLLNARQVDHLQTIVLSFSDVTELKQAEIALQAGKNQLAQHATELERLVEERTASLRETVRELEAFSYSMVHDMRAPLRAMHSFARMVHEGYGTRLDDAGRDYLTRISNSAERLDQLIQDVLNYTHVLRDPAVLTEVNVEHLLRELQATYPNWSQPHADIQIVSPIPAVLGHTALLAQCFSNLVGNAIRFVAPGVQPRIRIWAEPREESVRINIQDNGIGIPPECHHRVFGMFQRLHPANEYEGTGIGLTIVRRAAQRMGGQVGFDSKPGEGSIFWVELSRAHVK